MRCAAAVTISPGYDKRLWKLFIIAAAGKKFSLTMEWIKNVGHKMFNRFIKVLGVKNVGYKIPTWRVHI